MELKEKAGLVLQGSRVKVCHDFSRKREKTKRDTTKIFMITVFTVY
jgi:hypothetical protein